jgi:hypothetical protein
VIKAVYLLGQHWFEFCPPVFAALILAGLLYWALWLNGWIGRR